MRSIVKKAWCDQCSAVGGGSSGSGAGAAQTPVIPETRPCQPAVSRASILSCETTQPDRLDHPVLIKGKLYQSRTFTQCHTQTQNDNYFGALTFIVKYLKQFLTRAFLLSHSPVSQLVLERWFLPPSIQRNSLNVERQ